MAVRDDRSDVKQTTTGFRGPLMVQSLTSAKSKFLSLEIYENRPEHFYPKYEPSEIEPEYRTDKGFKELLCLINK